MQDTYKSRSSRLSVIGSFGIFAFAEKYFCLGLDIWVSQVMKSDLWQSCPLQDPVQHLEDAIREDRSACQRREHVLIAAAFLFLLFQDSYRISSQRDGSVGIFCFQRGLYHFFVDPGDLD